MDVLDDFERQMSQAMILARTILAKLDKAPAPELLALSPHNSKNSSPAIKPLLLQERLQSHA